MTKHQAIFASDLHGNRYAYERIFSVAKAEGIRTIILGGDLTPKWSILSFGNGALVPLTPKDLRVDRNGLTYVDFLTGMEPKAKFRSKAEPYYVSLGGYVQHTGTHLRWGELLEEQRLLGKFVDVVQRISNQSLPTLNEAEWRRLEPLLRRTAAKRSEKAAIDEILLAAALFTAPREERDAIALFHNGFQKLLSPNRDQDGSWAVRRVKALAYGMSAHLREVMDDPQKYLALFLGLVTEAVHSGPLSLWIERTQTLENAVQPQKSFLEHYFTTWLKRIRTELPETRVFLILGNDDVEQCKPVVERLQEKGLATVIHHRVVDLDDGLQIAGYPFVPQNDRFYAAWHKSEDDILDDLRTLESWTKGAENTVFVVHCPPGFSELDLAFGGVHYGSHGVRTWLEQGKKRAVLSGHIHEAPFLNGGVWRETIDGTPCFQPGGWHDEGLCAVVLDLQDPADARWIRNPP